MYDSLVKLAERLNKGPISEELKDELYSVAMSAGPVTPFEAMPETIFEQLMGEDFQSTMGMPIPASLHNSGAIDSETNHEFTRDNACNYFQPSEICALDGRICLYDTATFPTCPRYKEAFSNGVPGLDGQKPTMPPVDEIPKDPTYNQPPFNNHLQ